MTLRDLTDAQLIRVWNRILSAIPRDCYGADRPTLYANDPALCRAYDAVRAEGLRRQAEGGAR